MDYERDGKVTLSLRLLRAPMCEYCSVCLCRVKREQCERDVLLVILCIVVTANNTNNKCNSQTERETITMVQRLCLCGFKWKLSNAKIIHQSHFYEIPPELETVSELFRRCTESPNNKPKLNISSRISYIRILPDAFSLLSLSLVKSKVFYPRKRAHRLRTYSTHIGALRRCTAYTYMRN